MSEEQLMVACKTSNLLCHICGKTESEILGPVNHRDHDHLTGQFRGWAHEKCNQNYTIKFKPIPVIMHNFKGYDNMMFIKEASKFSDVKFEPLVENSEKFKTLKLTLTKHSSKNGAPCCQFIDSLAHINASLDKLVQNQANYSCDDSGFPDFIQKSNTEQLRKDFPAVSHEFSDDTHFKLLLRKGVFPYDYFTSLSQLESTDLIAKSEFYSVLKEEHISDDNYEHYLNVMKTLNLRTFGDYYNIYLTLDVLLLADVWRAYQHLGLTEFGLDPSHFITLPSFSWNCFLKDNKIPIENMSNDDMHLMIKAGIRGGLSFVAKKYCKANNPEMGDLYDNSMPNTFIHYHDFNNLYGSAMKEPVPVGGYKFIDEDDFKHENPMDILAKYKETKTIGYIFEVDLLYPEELHDDHNDYPLAPQRLKLDNTEKLVSSFLPIKNYPVSAITLACYIENGLVLEKIHRIMTFRKAAVIKPFIEKCTKLRAASKSEFAKNFYKLCANTVYGGCLLNPMNFTNFEIVTDKARYDMISRNIHLIKAEPWVFPCSNCSSQKKKFYSCSRKQSCLVGLVKIKREVTFSRPLIIGFHVLELAKLAMYNYWYGFVKKHYGDRATLLATDTDSFIMEIQTDNIVEDLAKYPDKFDFSNFNPAHQLYSTKHKKVPGYMKVEFPGKIIIRFVGLRSKCYGLEFLEDEDEVMVAKGVGKVAKQKLTLNMYEKALDGEISRVEEVKLQSQKMTMCVLQRSKIALSADDNKRVWSGDKNKSTLAIGHKDLL